jgi:hypothetical protein
MTSTFGFDILERFLTNRGIDLLAPHTGQNYGNHLRGTYSLLQTKGYDEEMCLAGFFHSIYGTEENQIAIPVSERESLKQLIGTWAENISWLHCVVSRSSLYKAISDLGPCLNRMDDQVIEISPSDFRALSIIHFYEWIEQSSRTSKRDRGVMSLQGFAKAIEHRGFQS